MTESIHSRTSAPAFDERRHEADDDRGPIATITRGWPYGLRGFASLGLSILVLSVMWTAVGFLVTEFGEPSALGQREADSVQWLEVNRSASWTDVAHMASRPADTFVVIALIVVAGVVFGLLRWWRPLAFLVSAMLVEVLVALTSSFLVARPRPDVEQLATPPTESWPSGHVAAATAFYFAIALILSSRVRHRWMARLLFVLAAMVALTVAASRLYLGAHYPSDVVGGALLGAAALAVTHRLVDPRDSSEPAVEAAAGPAGGAD